LQAKLIRCHPSDGLNGFFVAVFEKQAVSPIESKGKPFFSLFVLH
jgi:hypothetical protein